MTSTAQQVLLDAADLIETRGLCKGRYHRDGKYCALGAITWASIQHPEPTQTHAERALQRIVGPKVGAWNDRPWRTKKSVARALRKAARGLDP